MSVPKGLDGIELRVGVHVQIHGVPDNNVRSLLNGKRGICEKWDPQVRRVFVRISHSESLAFSPEHLRSSDEAVEDPRYRGIVPPPRGSGGFLLRPGTIVRIHGFHGDSAYLNDQEGVCEMWDKQTRMMSVRLQSGGVPKAISTNHLRKVRMHDEDSMDPEAKRALGVFQSFDSDGDGILEIGEFAQVLAALGVSRPTITLYLSQVDKNEDKHVSYDEFLSWALTPVDTTKLLLDMYWPEGGRKAEVVVETVKHPEKPPSDAELERQELEREVGPLPAKWPKHGMAAVNNCRIRFPDYPLKDIVQKLEENNFMGGMAIAAIRKTGARENEAMRAGHPLIK